MTDEEILAGAPKDGLCTHFDFIKLEYWKFSDSWYEWVRFVNNSRGWFKSEPFESNLRSLADIARIVELEKDVAFLQSCVNTGETATEGDRV
jgi:hypothetical protein